MDSQLEEKACAALWPSGLFQGFSGGPLQRENNQAPAQQERALQYL